MGQDWLGGRLRDEGYAVVHRALDAGFLERARSHLFALRSRRLGSDADAIVTALPSDASAARLAAHDVVVEIAKVALGAAPVCFGFTYLCKPAVTGLAASWHQDLGPWADALGESRAVTLWIALDDADESNGCLKVLPGSHLGPTHALELEAARSSMFGVHVAQGLVDERASVSLVVEAGTVVVLDPNLIHGSSPNHSPRDRTALGVRYRTIREAEGPRSGITALVAESASDLGRAPTRVEEPVDASRQD